MRFLKRYDLFNVILILLYPALFFHIFILILISLKFFTTEFTGSTLIFTVLLFDVVALSLLLYHIHKLKNKININDMIFKNEINRREAYLQYASRIIRHDLNSGINIYIPRGVTGVKRVTKDLNLGKSFDRSMNLIERGLIHSRYIYTGVKEFTEMFRDGQNITKSEYDLTELINDYLKNLHYSNLVEVSDLGKVEVNGSLFCIAIDNLIRNGLTYNDSKYRNVKIYRTGNYLCVEDNGRGINKERFMSYIKPFKRNNKQREPGTGLGITICYSIIKEHGFDIDVVKLESGSIIKIELGETVNG